MHLINKDIVGIAGKIAFVRKIRPALYRKFSVVYEVGKIVPLYRRVQGCSPMFKDNESGLTALHCVADMCRLSPGVYDDGSPVNVVKYINYKYCRRWICKILGKHRITERVILNRCIEDHDHAWVDKYNSEYTNPVGILFAGSEDGRLALILSEQDITGKLVKIISYDYFEGQEKEWVAKIDGSGLFKVDFEEALLWFSAYYIYPTPVTVRPGFSGSNVFLII